MDTLRKEFQAVMAAAGTKNENQLFEAFLKKYETDKAAKQEIARLVKEGVATSGKRIEELSLKIQLQEASEMINLSYIARHYFKKTKSWLSQRINAHIVNGKQAVFTDEELKTLNFALKDMGKKIGSFSVHH